MSGVREPELDRGLALDRMTGARAEVAAYRPDTPPGAPGLPSFGREAVLPGACAATVAAIEAGRARDRRRGVAVAAGILGVIVGVGMLALALGDVPLAPAEVVAGLLGLDGAGGATFIVQGLRLPRLALALVVGAALGFSGALLQSVVRNPLASPDIVGVTGGASAAGVLAIAAGATGLAVSGAALVGALAATAVVVAASGRGVGGARFVVVGIAVAFLANGIVGYGLTRANLTQAESAYFWLVGSVGSPSWEDVALVGGVVLVAAGAHVAARRALEALALDDGSARAIGARPVATRVAAMTGSSILAAVAVSVAGPIAFVAFAAGPIARRMRGRGPALATAALTGAAIVALADLIAQHLVPGALEPPVGLITGAAGAVVLLVLLVRGERSGGRPASPRSSIRTAPRITPRSPTRKDRA